MAQVQIPEQVRALIPGFLSRRVDDIQALRQFFEAQNFPELSMIGHRLKGCGTAYGFKMVSDVGAQIESAANQKDITLLRALISDYETIIMDLKKQIELN